LFSRENCDPILALLVYLASQITYLPNKHWLAAPKLVKVVWFLKQSPTYKGQEKQADEAACFGLPLMKRLQWKFNLD